MPITDIDTERFVENFWLNVGEVDYGSLVNPFRLSPEELADPGRYFLKEMMKPERFYFTCKHLFNLNLAPFQLVMLSEMWNRPYPMIIGARGASKTMMLALFCMLKATLNQGIKIIVCGTGLRQSKLVFEYCLKIWESSDMLRDIMHSCGKKDQGPHTSVEKLVFKLGESEVTFLPIGMGDKIRGFRAGVLITDEFQHHNPEIFEVVLSGFTSVSSSPIESMKYSGRIKAMKALGIPIPLGLDGQRNTNQSIISGTAYYSFNHFCVYWKKWKSIIESKGDTTKLEEIFQGYVPPAFSWKDFSILRLPIELVPEGFMDEKSIAKSKVSMHSSAYQMEFGAVFSSDSSGFFKRTLIEGCVARDTEPVEVAGKSITFNARVNGNPNLKYIFGVDPASEKDRFTIVIIELQDGHRRIVYGWSTVRAEFQKKMKGDDTPNDFYEYCSRKIRELMNQFPCERIVMDAQGGGRSISEALHNKSYLKANELPIWEIIDEEKEKPTDLESGLHILELAEFSKAIWVSEANHGMKKDFEDKVLLFPDYDAGLVTLAQIQDELKVTSSRYDTMEDCLSEIEALKDELCTIVHTQTGQQLRDRWDTPEVKLPGGKKGRDRKDRYSALLMANMAARIIQSYRPSGFSDFYGARVGKDEKPKMTGKMYISAPDWFLENATDVPGMVVQPRNIYW